jgi:dihydrofolate reductase
MRRIIGSVFQSLDGVMQAPGGPTEDWTGGFPFGGWMFSFADEAVGNAVGKLFFGEPFDLLLGRKTYEIFAAYWPYVAADHPIGQAFGRAAKHVLTSSADPLEWSNSHRLASVAEIAALKRTDGPDLIIQGSSTLYPQLMAEGLIDRLTLLTFPVVLGQGKRLFAPGAPSGTFRVTEHLVSAGGVVIATYEPSGPVAPGSFPPVPSNPTEERRQARMRREG